MVIADDDLPVLSSLRDLFRATGRWEVVATVTTGDDLVIAVEVHRPDLVLTDLHMPGGEVELIERLGALVDRPLVVTLSAAASPRLARQLLDAGCDLVLRKGIDSVVVAAERLVDERFGVDQPLRPRT